MKFHLIIRNSSTILFYSIGCNGTRTAQNYYLILNLSKSNIYEQKYSYSES